MSQPNINLGGSTESNTGQQRTNIELENPRHEDKSCNYADSPEDALAYFEAANAAKNYNEPREKLVGEFLVGLHKSQSQGNTDYLVAVTEALTGLSLEVAEPDSDEDE